MNPWAWVGFNAFLILLLAADLGLIGRKSHTIHVREAMIRSAFWISLAFGFAGFVWWWRGPRSATEFMAGYLIEESLSVDNLFVMLIIFSYFQVPRQYQHKVLFWGIIGALVFRAIFIIVGVTLIQRFEWTIYIFGAILVYTAIKLLVSNEDFDPQQNVFLRVGRRLLPMSDSFDGDRFMTRVDGKLKFTPMFLVLGVVETTDIVFAVDSVPAVLAISKDPFIVYTSNAFAILGLRSLYFALAGMLDAFHYLRYGLSGILGFVGFKMLLHHWIEIPIGIALATVGGILFLSIVASLVFKKPRPAEPIVEETHGDGADPG